MAAEQRTPMKGRLLFPKSPCTAKNTNSFEGKNAGKLYASGSETQRVRNVVGRIRDFRVSKLLSVFTRIATTQPKVMDVIEHELDGFEDGDRKEVATVEVDSTEYEKLRARVAELEDELALYEAEKVRALCEKLQKLRDLQMGVIESKEKSSAQCSVSNDSPCVVEPAGFEIRKESGKGSEEKEEDKDNPGKETQPCGAERGVGPGVSRQVSCAEGLDSLGGDVSPSVSGSGDNGDYVANAKCGDEAQMDENTTVVGKKRRAEADEDDDGKESTNKRAKGDWASPCRGMECTAAS